LFEPVRASANSGEPVVNTGLANSGERKVRRFGAIARTLSQHPNSEEETCSERAVPSAQPEAARSLPRILTVSAARIVTFIGLTTVRGAVRYPRAALVTVLSSAILGTIALTPSGRSLPDAQIRSDGISSAPGQGTAGPEQKGATKPEPGTIAKEDS